MADIRIKDLTTLESASLTGDVFVIDGTTGTRKLSAFSPSFGGNATVTGTLTANGVYSASGNHSLRLLPDATDPFGGLNSSFARIISTFVEASAGAAYFGHNDTGATFISNTRDSASLGVINFGTTVSGTHATRVRITNGGNVLVGGTTDISGTGGLKVFGTTASTTTSSGALVVSGGVGVGGSIYAGGDIAIPADRGIYIKQGNPERWTSDGTPTGTSRADIYADSAGAFFIRTGGLTQALTISSGQNATFAGSITAGVGTHSFGTSAGGGVNNFGALLTYFNIRSTSDSDNPIFRVYDGRVNVSAFEVNARTGAATATGTFTANTSVSSPQLVISSDSLGLSGGAGFYKKEADTVALGVMTSNTLRAFIRTTDARWFYQSGTPVTIQDTTASTSTSSGALVVSGGVGVAGAVYSAGLFGNAVDVSSNPVTFASSGGCVMSYSGSGVGVIRPYANGSGAGTSSLQLRPSGTLAVTVSASTVELAGGIDLKLGNAYTAGAPTATGYIVIKDSTGTSYKIPAVAL